MTAPTPRYRLPAAGAPANGSSGAGAAWPGDDNPDWMHDTRPAAASIPGELFPESHARAVQAASPVDVGLAAIKAHDPGFDLEQFTQQVQRSFFIVQEAWSERKPEMSRQVMADGLWQQHRDQIQGYVDGHKRNMLDYLAVSNIWPVAAHSDNRMTPSPSGCRRLRRLRRRRQDRAGSAGRPPGKAVGRGLDVPAVFARPSPKRVGPR